MSSCMPYVSDPSPCLERLNAKPWPFAALRTSHGVRIGFRSTHSAAMATLIDRIRPVLTVATEPCVDALYSLIIGEAPNTRSRVRRFHLAYEGHRLVGRMLDLPTLLDQVESDVHFHIAQNAPAGLFVHAGVVGWRGRAIVLPGQSNTGKTTLVRALVQSGATYLSDEYAIIGTDGRVHPYPRDLFVRRQDGSKQRCPPEHLQADVGTQPLPVGCVVTTQFRNRSVWRPRVASLGETVLALLGNTVQARRHPETGLEVLTRAARTARRFKGPRGDATDTAKHILAQSQE